VRILLVDAGQREVREPLHGLGGQRVIGTDGAWHDDHRARREHECKTGGTSSHECRHPAGGRWECGLESSLPIGRYLAGGGGAITGSGTLFLMAGIDLRYANIAF